MHKIRLIQFVDGENLVMRYQALIEKGRLAKPGVVHKKDVYVWHEGLTHYFDRGFLSVYYYTSVVGDDNLVTETKRELAALQYLYMPMVAGGAKLQLVPVVFKKPKRGERARKVDIQIVIDVLRSAASDSCDMIFLASGDGDYLPLISEAMRAGKQVCVAAFSSGLNAALPHSVNKFINFDELFFVPNAG